jgi:hypothetical protein
MLHSRVVAPQTIRLTLSGGDWVDVQKELNAGDYYDLLLALVDRKPFAKLLTYLVSWSLLGLDGQPLPYTRELPEALRRDTIRSLDKGTVRELIGLLDRHEAAVDAEREEKKRVPAGVGA